MSSLAQDQSFLQELLNAFQQTLRGNQESPEVKTQAQKTEYRHPKKKRRRTNFRRDLFDYTVRRHYSRFVPENQHQNGTTVTPSEQFTQCATFEPLDGYWSYKWCPGKYVSQFHLGPKILEDGTVVAWKTTDVLSLGTFSPLPDQLFGWENITTEHESLLEYHVGGAECPGSQGRKRETLVVHKGNCQFKIKNNGKYRITKVLEPKPCHYLINICERKYGDTELKNIPPNHPEPQSHNTLHAQTNNTETRERVNQIVVTFTQLSGIDEEAQVVLDKREPLRTALPPFPPSLKKSNLKLIKEMFGRAYDSYMYHAYPSSELKPLSCSAGVFNLVRLPALTLIDTLDTLVLMNNFTEFARSVERLRDLDTSLREAVEQKKDDKMYLIEGGLFAANQNVSVFETNIRVLGGLLSAHQMAEAFLDGKVLLKNVRANEDGEVLIGPVATNPCPTLFDVEQFDEQFGTETQSDECVASTEEVNKNTCTITEKNAVNMTRSHKSQYQYWQYDGYLLRLAQDIGTRLLAAFETRTGIPYGTVNLLYGIPPRETVIASLAGGGTLTLEFEMLSRLTGDDTFGKAAKLATRALWSRRSQKHLLGKHINIQKGDWTEHLSGIGSNSDSFYEYLIKHFILFPEDPDFWPMFLSTYYGVRNESRIGEWYGDVDMNAGRSGSTRRIFESLMAFYPGMQVLLGEVCPAAKTLNSFFMAREFLGFLPERFNYANWRVDGLANSGAGLHPLRPELLESSYFLHRASRSFCKQRRTGNKAEKISTDEQGSGWLWASDYALHNINWHASAKCGFAAIRGLSSQGTGGVPGAPGEENHRPRLLDEMPSFFLSETLKYLYLTFDDDNLLHQDDDRQWIFTTEAHPLHFQSRSSNEPNASNKESLRGKLKELLTKRSKSRFSGNMYTSGITHSRASKHEKWSEKSHSGNFVRDIVETERVIMTSPNKQWFGVTREMNARELLNHDEFIKPSAVKVPERTRLLDLPVGYDQDETNIAHLSLSAFGAAATMSLPKGCPHFTSPSLLWIAALSGGLTDYGGTYVSSTTDEIPKDSKYGTGLLSSSHALALLSSGLFFGEDIDANLCLLKMHEKEEPKAAARPRKPSNGEVQRFDMGGHLGNFDVSLFGEGNGFSIRQVNTDQRIIATIISDGKKEKEDQGEPDAYIMVYATSPPSSKAVNTESKWRIPGVSSWSSVFGGGIGASNDAIAIRNLKPDRHVVISDTASNTFRCEIEVVRRSNGGEKHFASTNMEESMCYEDSIALFPCAPALFGATELRNVISKGGVFSEGLLLGPRIGDEEGCQDVTKGVFSHSQPVVRLVMRGSCSFRLKCNNQVAREDAAGVVVINSDDDELFLMSEGSPLDAGKVNENEQQIVPTSILVTGRDGKELVNLANQDGGLYARVSLRAQSVIVGENGEIMKSSLKKMQWPIVQATPETVQIFAKGGWGVHAVAHSVDISENESKPSSTSHSAKEWQLFLLQHSEL